MSDHCRVAGAFVAAELVVVHAMDLSDVRVVAELRGLQLDAADAMRIGAAERLGDIARHPLLAERYPMLAAACAAATTTAGDSATLGDSLAQRPQCPVFRRNEPCLKNGGDTCLAHDVENQTLAILEGGPCWAPQPSDPAVALVALDAIISVVGAAGARLVPASQFFVLPTQRLDREIALNDGELIVSVILPAAAAAGLQRFTKSATAGSDHPSISVALARRTNGEVRLVLGGVSPRPYRVYNSVEEEATTDQLDDDTIEGLAERALLDAEPLSNNGVKVEHAALLLRDAIRQISSS